VSPAPSHEALQYFCPSGGLHVHGGFLHFRSSAISPPETNLLLKEMLYRWAKLNTIAPLIGKRVWTKMRSVSTICANGWFAK
jgi:hypothetical protein